MAKIMDSHRAWETELDFEKRVEILPITNFPKGLLISSEEVLRSNTYICTWHSDAVHLFLPLYIEVIKLAYSMFCRLTRSTLTMHGTR